MRAGRKFLKKFFAHFLQNLSPPADTRLISFGFEGDASHERQDEKNHAGGRSGYASRRCGGRRRILRRMRNAKQAQNAPPSASRRGFDERRTGKPFQFFIMFLR